MRVKIKNLAINGGTELKFDLNWLPRLKISDLLAHPQCLFVPATEFNFYGFNATVEMLELEVDVTLISRDDGPHVFAYRTNDSTKLATVVSTLMSQGASLLQKALDSSSVIQLNAANYLCTTPANPHKDHFAEHSSSAAGIWTVLIVVAFITGNTWLFLRGFKKDADRGEVVANQEPQSHVDEKDETQADHEVEFTR